MEKLCKYYYEYKNKLPADLPGPVTAALDAVCAAVRLLLEYDRQHQGGSL